MSLPEHRHYRLTPDHQVEPVDDVLVWAQWFERADRQVARDTLPSGTFVSTVFLGLNHQWGHGDQPLLFETMVFGGPLHERQARYSTWDAAVRGHAELLARVQRAEAQGETHV